MLQLYSSLYHISNIFHFSPFPKNCLLLIIKTLFHKKHLHNTSAIYSYGIVYGFRSAVYNHLFIKHRKYFHFFLMLKFNGFKLFYGSVYNRSERLHNVRAQIKLIKHIVMEKANLCNISICGDFSVKT